MKLTISYDKDIFDECRQQITDEIRNRLIQAGEEAISHAKITKTYNNITWDLMNAYGYGVVVFGELVKINVPADGAHHHVIAETTDTLNNVARTIKGIALILANGKEYSSYVEAKGRLVLTDTAIWAKNSLD